jgi:hypothetical protein
MSHDEIDWTPEEREALDRLPREDDPGELLEERTVAALRGEGLLGPGRDVPVRRSDDSLSARTPRHRGVFGARPAAGWWAAGIAAALAVFFGGVALGQAHTSAATVDLVRAIRTAETGDRPSLIQQTGSLYVDAVASLATARAQGNEEAVGTGVEVGIAALYAAAYEMARLHPENPQLRAVLQVLEPPATDADSEAGVHWF